MNQTISLSAVPLLTIAIPTWNRARYLEKNLAQLHAQLAKIPPGSVEILVSDNCSSDSTLEVVECAKKIGLPIRYVRNETNVGWALNFAQCFDLANGKYVLLLGDDDIIVDDALPLLLDRLARKNYGVVCLRPFGFDTDFRQENPGGTGHERVFQQADQFLVKISRYFTLTSACVLNKSLLTGVDSKQFITTDLATFHLLLRAALAASENLFIEKYLIASKRQNSFSYEYSSVFVGQLWKIIDAHVPFGLSRKAVRTIERDKLFCYYPFYMLDLRLSGRGNLQSTYDAFDRRFHDRWIFKYWLAPIIRLPRPLAIVWGVTATVIGRIANGDIRRGVKFAWSKLVRLLGLARSSQN